MSLPVWGTSARQSDSGCACLFRLQSGLCFCFPSPGYVMLCTCVMLIVAGSVFSSVMIVTS